MIDVANWKLYLKDCEEKLSKIQLPTYQALSQMVIKIEAKAIRWDPKDVEFSIELYVGFMMCFWMNSWNATQ